MNATRLLVPVLIVDAVTCLAMGGLLTAAAAPLAGLLALPAGLLLEAGLVLFPYALFVLWAARNADRGWPVRTVAFANLAWVAASFGLLAMPLVAPNALGIAFVAAQAVAVGTLALLQLRLPRAARMPA